MLVQIEVFLREIRRWFSRSEWIIRVLGLPRSTEKNTAPGLILIQIDGLSRPQLESGLQHNKMPFLKRMINQEHYQCHSLYTGVPSSTPAVQGELFYGEKSIVPAFSFYDRVSGQVQTMYEPKSAHVIEEMLQKKNDALLKDGSAYCNVYSAGASEPHFCASSFGWGGLLRAANPFVFTFFLLSNFNSFIRTITLAFIELIVAIIDFFVGFIEGKNFFKELTFIPTRVVICILLRELVTIGTKIDIARGMPIIHLNFLGYDEQAHRRGPSSKFAHWTLKGIDDSIKRIWQAANRTSHRHYDIWIYSDHGQEDVTPFENIYGITTEQAINRVFKRWDIPASNSGKHGIQTQRARFLGGNLLQKIFIKYNDTQTPVSQSKPVITAMGPLGLIYAPEPLKPDDKPDLASQLVSAAHIPMVLYTDAENNVIARTAEGSFRLPRDRDKIFGDNHPFLNEVTEDIINVCLHKYAGDFTLLGWHARQKKYITFRLENGSHAGPGIHETHAFAVIPRDIEIESSQPYLRPSQLRQAAFDFTQRDTTPRHKRGKHSQTSTIRVMTYNVHSCIGMDGKVSPERIARVIARYHPDVVCLQELDVKRGRTQEIDQAHYLAQMLAMKFHFHPAIHVEEERYGDAILTHLPIKLIKADILPANDQAGLLEPRGALWACVEKNGVAVNIFNTHLDIRKRARQQQLSSLLGNEWITNEKCSGPTILCGDFNLFPSSDLYRSITETMYDTQTSNNSLSAKPTFFTRFPSARIDYIFIDKSSQVKKTYIPNNSLTRVASDHFPLIADITVVE